MIFDDTETAAERHEAIVAELDGNEHERRRLLAYRQSVWDELERRKIDLRCKKNSKDPLEFGAVPALQARVAELFQREGDLAVQISAVEAKRSELLLNKTKLEQTYRPRLVADDESAELMIRRLLEHDHA